MAKYGLQMYSVRDLTGNSMKDALEKVAALGYHYIEYAGFFGNTAEDVKAWMDELGLECSGTHTHLSALADENIEETIKYHKTIGCDNIIVPSCDWSSKEKCEGVLAAFEKAQKTLAEHGIRLGYHNHSMEFLPTPDGIVFEDELFEKTNVEMEIDTFWLFNSGLDTIEYLEAHKDRIKVIHIKDGIPSAAEDKVYGRAHNNVQGKSLGSGEAPVKAVHDWAVKNNVLMVVESEGLDPTGIEEVGRCIDYLNSID